MSESAQRSLFALMLSALLITGCANEANLGRKYELEEKHHLAYEEYLKSVKAKPNDNAAAAGLRRTAPKAVKYWQWHAIKTAECEEWNRAAMCHLKALQIKPDEQSSLFTLRQIGQHHPNDVKLAYEALSSGRLSREVLALAMAIQEPGITDTMEASKPVRSATTKPQVEPKPTIPAGEQRVVTAGPEPIAPPELPTPTRPKEHPRVRRAGSHEQQPSVRHEPGASEGDFIMIVRVSRDDDRYPKKAPLANGLEIKVKDTDKSPLDADIEVYLNRRRIGKFKDLRENSIISVVDRSSNAYEIVILDIYDPEETVTVGLRKE